MRNKKTMKTLHLLLLTKKVRIGLALILVLFTLAIYLKLNYVAIVNGHLIQRSSYQNKLTQTNSFYSFSKQDSSLTAPVKNDTVDGLVDEQLVEKYAKDHKITVSETEVMSYYQAIVSKFNQRNGLGNGDDKKYSSRIKELYDLDKTEYMQSIREDILRQKVQGKIGIPLLDWLNQQKKKGIILKF